MKAWLRAKLPDPRALVASRWLRWAQPWLGDGRLWHLNRRTVALGAAIGVFFAFILPVAQFPFAALIAIALRANLPAAVSSTLVSNPVTYGPIYAAAYFVGLVLLEGDLAAAFEAVQQARAQGMSVTAWIEAAWKPLFLGLSVFAVLGALSAYSAVLLAWRLAVVLQLKRRQTRPR